MEPLEKEIEKVWNGLDLQKGELLTTGKSRILSDLEVELKLLLNSVRSTLDEENRDVTGNIEKIDSLARQFRDGVELWERKASTSIKMIEERQRSLNTIVEETQSRCNYRNDCLKKRHFERISECDRVCSEFFSL
ncbi:hypothetical protein AGDE_03692 [Angomonas deanei]|nr:hypothetical protein AGDE_10138 [Angomonas deanei]EPY39292.1 hypothetical protein AGDE_04636 [Angomonas deanei]EPY40236.1 hypothetical protein AGDE_03692 [Angomonas deanei]|eukprot:EPY29075.1 hypothetical protein AGDE_10138 [Angomonas deanei]